MGEVYRAFDPRLGREVALKVLLQAADGDPNRLRRFEDEARAAGLLNHPNILTVYDVGTHDGTPYIVSELLEGETLGARLEDGKVSVRTAVDWARQIAQGLAAAHDKGIVHRDLKPANLFLTADGRIKILDFGLAKLTQPRGGPSDPAGWDQPTATEPGTVLGTSAYMSPEQVRGQAVDLRSDLFSAGVILTEMLTGRPAFARPTRADTMAAVLTEDPHVPPTTPAALRQIILHLLEKDPGARFQSARDLAFDLESLLLSRSRPPTSRKPPARRSSAPPHRERSRTASPLVERRVITALAIELARPDLTIPVSPERLKRALDEALAAFQGFIRTEGAFIERVAADSIYARFGAPVAHSDDPDRALRAAQACAQWTESNRHARVPLVTRIGIETGEAVVDVAAVGSDRPSSAGDCLTIAMRLQQLAEPGWVLVGPTCRRGASAAAEFGDIGEVELKGIGRIAISKLTTVAPRAAAVRLPLVGRDADLDLLRLAYRRTRASRSGLVVVSGPPGQGKSRVVEEFIAGVDGEAHVLHARCRPSGESTRSPLVALLMPHGVRGSADALATRLADLFPDPLERRRVLEALGHSTGLSVSRELAALPNEQSQDEVRNAWRRYFLALSREKPIVAWIDDLHWADADIVHLVDRLTFESDLPLLVIATARPEFQAHGALRSGGDRFFMTLDKLADSDGRRLAELAGGTARSGLERAEGNPLFIIELSRARDVPGHGIPVTLHGAIGARLDELPTEDRELLQRAAVAGETFNVADASLLSGRPAQSVASAIDRLCDLTYLQRVPAGFRFHHVLVRDVAYGRLTVGERVRLHAKYAREGVSADDSAAMAHHLWEALGADDAEWVWEGSADLLELRERARDAHLTAAKRLAARFAYARAIDTARRARRFATSSADIAIVEHTLGDVLGASGDADEAAAHYLRARELYRTAGAPPADLYPTFLEQVVYNSGMFKTPLEPSRIEELLREGEAAARQADDATSLARILGLWAYRSHDGAQLAEALHLSESATNRPALASFLNHAAILQNRVGDFALASRTFEQLDAIEPGEESSDRQMEFRAILALNRGEVDEAVRVADQFLLASASRGPHLRTHAFREHAHVLLARGEWTALGDLADRCERLVADHPETSFCYAVTTVRAFALVARALSGEVEQAHAMLSQVEAPLQTEPFEREAVLALAYGVLGRRDAVQALADATPASPARMWTFQRSHAVALTMLQHWADLEGVLPALDRIARHGKESPYLEALVAAMREEMAFARGGQRPAHVALERLGYHGWSQLVAFRPRPD